MGIPRRRWLWMLLGLVLGLSATAGVGIFLKPTYVAGATILVTSQSIPEEFVRSTVTEDPFSRLNAMGATVLSRQKLLELLDEFGLYPKLREKSSIDTVLEKMRSKIVIEAQSNITAGSPGGQESGTFKVSFEASDPDVAAQVANRLASLFVQGGLRSRMEHAVGISEFMRNELERTDVALRTVAKEIAEFQEAHRGSLPTELEANQRRLDRLQDQRTSLARQIAEAESRLATLSYSPALAPTPSVNQLRLKTLRSRYEGELAIHTEEHPSVIALARQLEELEKLVAQEPESSESAENSEREVMIQAARKKIEGLRHELEETEDQIVVIDHRVQATPKTGEELAALEERATVLRTKYLEFLRKVSEADMAQTLEAAQYGARVTIADPAEPPSEPKQPLNRLIAIGIAASFVLALALGVLFEALDPIVADASQVESLSGLPVLGSVTRLV